MLAARWRWNVDSEPDPDPGRHSIVYSRLLSFLFVPRLSSNRTDELSLNASHYRICHSPFFRRSFNEPLDRFHIDIHMRDYGSFELCGRKQRINKSIPSSHNTFLVHAKLISSLPKYLHFSVRRTPRIEMLSDLSSEMKHVIANYEHVFWITYSWAGLKSLRFKAGIVPRDGEEWDRQKKRERERERRQRNGVCVCSGTNNITRADSCTAQMRNDEKKPESFLFG